jgi:hypothetical protein
MRRAKLIRRLCPSCVLAYCHKNGFLIDVFQILLTEAPGRFNIVRRYKKKVMKTGGTILWNIV